MYVVIVSPKTEAMKYILSQVSEAESKTRCGECDTTCLFFFLSSPHFKLGEKTRIIKRTNKTIDVSEFFVRKCFESEFIL